MSFSIVDSPSCRAESCLEYDISGVSGRKHCVEELDLCPHKSTGCTLGSRTAPYKDKVNLVEIIEEPMPPQAVAEPA